jgi:plasmid stabilization system protein ParE
MNFIYRPEFLEDMAREELYLLEHAGVEIAGAWHEALWETLGFLNQTPLTGRLRTDLKFSGIRSWRVSRFERWIVFYGVREQDLVFYRVVSGTMNLYALDLKNG